MLRGIAILGILPVNAWWFAYPSDVGDEWSYPPGGGSETAVGLVSWLFEWKMITLFALLFGVGIGVQRLRAESSGRPFGPPMARRLATLTLLGALHATLLWWGDVVFVYGTLGLVLAWCAAGRPAVLSWVGALALLPPLALLGLKLLVALLFGGELDGWEGPADEAAVYAGGSFAEICALRVATWAEMLVFAYVAWGPRIGGLFLLGMAAARSRWALAPDSPDGARLHRRIARLALPAGLLVEGLAAWTAVEATTAAADTLAEIAHYVGSLVLAAGYASGAALLVARRPGAAWTRPLAAVGRTAFSCYIGQSVLMTYVFYSHGLGLFGRVERWDVLALVAIVWALELLVATLWLRFFRLGPLEWLWRTATHLAPEPLLVRRAA